MALRVYVSQPDSSVVAELILHLTAPRIVEQDGTKRGTAQAWLSYLPADGKGGAPSPKFDFTAPLGPIEAEELSWYLERFIRWPGEAFRSRAEKVEAALPVWGRMLFDAALGAPQAVEVLTAWEKAPPHARLITVQLHDAPPPELDMEEWDDALKHRMAAAAHLLTLPWELLHDRQGYLFHRGARVRRGVPVLHQVPGHTAPSPLRVLLLSPRPVEEGTGYIDHRIAAKPLLEAMASLGDMAELVILPEPSFPALRDALRQAKEAGKPFHVVHFDGHGVFHLGWGRGALCFERPGQGKELLARRQDLVDARKLANGLSRFALPLVFLEACQTGQAEANPVSSVAAALLEAGVGAVVAMSHSVLVETARQFMPRFYQALAQGAPVGEAMLAGQGHLFQHKHRGHWLDAGALELHDWFVPVLYQVGADLALVRRHDVQPAPRPPLVLGELPAPPEHHFVGRSRELLAIERLLLRESHAVLIGEGGEGKTALACEAARWLAAMGRVGRVAFVSLEHNTHVNAVLDVLGRQLVGEGYAVATYPDLQDAWLPVEAALRGEVTLLVLDNMETVLPPRPGAPPGAHEPEELENLIELFQLFQGVDGTRILFTSRENLPAPFADDDFHVVHIGALGDWDGVELIKNVLLRDKIKPYADKSDDDREKALLELVKTVHGHARTLVMLAPELARSGVGQTTASLHTLMTGLERKYPGQRERSLYAGVALSLNRLSPETRRLIRPLGVFEGGGHLNIVGYVLGIDDQNQLLDLAAELTQTGLCDVDEYNYLTFHFALCPFLWGEMVAEERQAARGRWLEGEESFVEFLHQQQFQDTKLAARLTLRDLPNLLAGLEGAGEVWPVERALEWAADMAGLLKNLGKRAAQQRVADLRQGLAQRLGAGWSHTRFETERAQVEALAGEGRLNAAREAALALLQRGLDAGEGAYAEAAYDLAMAHWLAGRYTRETGDATGAVPLVQEARTRFQGLGEGGGQDARLMAATALSDLGDCRQELGQLDEAARCYELVGQEAEAEGDRRGVAVSQGQLGAVWLRQRRYPEALAAYEEVRATFTTLDEPATVAICWHQTGMVYEEQQAWARAEEAYREALRIWTNQNLDDGVASTLNQLGLLFKNQGRWEEAVEHYGNAAAIYVRQGNQAKEGLVRNNLADTLVKLGRLGEARAEIQRAIECMEPFGHAAAPWTTWAILSAIETADHQPEAAAQARRQARALFAQYRRDGGENHEGGGPLCQTVAAALSQGAGAQMREQLEQVAQQPGLDSWYQALIPVLLAILAGARDPALAESPGLSYDVSVEVELLLEGLAPSPGGRTN